MAQSVVLLVDGKRFSCDRQILQRASPYFDAMFNLNMKEKDAKEIEIHDIEPSVFTVLLDYAYEKEVIINFENVIPLLRASNIFQFDTIQENCCEYLMKHLNVENCINTWKLSETLGIQNLCSYTKKFILYEFCNLRSEKDFLHLPLKLLVEFLSHEELNCNELEVFNLIACWAECTEYNQTTELISLLLCIRYTSLNQEEFEILMNHSLICENSENKEFLSMVTKRLIEASNDVEENVRENKCVNIFSLKTLEQKVAFAVSNPPRKLIFCPLIVGQFTTTDALKVKVNRWQECHPSSYLILCTRNQIKQFFWPFSKQNQFTTSNKHFYSKGGLCGCIACPVGNDLYVFGGEYRIGSGHWNKDIWKCNLNTFEWSNIGTMEHPRRHCLVTVVEETICLIGGYGKFRKRLTSVESYDTKTGCWKEQSSLPNPIESSIALPFEGKVYVFSSPIYCYDPIEDKWTEMLPWKEIGFSCAFVFKNEMYAVTKQNPAILLHFNLPNRTFEKEFVFPSYIICGCIIRNIFYGFCNEEVIAFNLLSHSYSIEHFQGYLNVEACCVIPYSDGM